MQSRNIICNFEISEFYRAKNLLIKSLSKNKITFLKGRYSLFPVGMRQNKTDSPPTK